MHELTKNIWGTGPSAGVHISYSWIDKCITTWLKEKLLQIYFETSLSERDRELIPKILGIEEEVKDEKPCKYHDHLKGMSNKCTTECFFSGD